jgi:prepilin-type N-terminal cleavage/methylation domain-containing protein
MSSKAFTLIEILIAITVITVGVVGSYAAITRVASLTLSS